MEKTASPADVQSGSSPFREIQLSDAQNAFQEIVDVIDIHKNCSCQADTIDLTKQIRLIADEIVKSKIRDKLLLSSKTDLTTKFAQMEINKQKENREGGLLKLQNQIAAQTKSISNQAKHLNTLVEKLEDVNQEADTSKQKIKKLNQEVKNLNQKVENLNQYVKNLKEEAETLKIENVKLSEKNDELLAQVNGMLQ